MLDWENNEFLSNWDKTYVSTNLKDGAKPYDREFFLSLNSLLKTSHPDLQNISHAIIATACCAVNRADLVGRFFGDITEDVTPEESQKIFFSVREAITIVFPYLGMPTCIPACYGIIGVVQHKGSEYASKKAFRKDTVDEEDARKGRELRGKIYKGVGNSQIFGLMDEYFTDMFTCSTVVTWGYLIAKANEEVFRQEESHFIIASTIMALGATRQTKSHIKATLGIGNSVDAVKFVVDVVGKIAAWADRPIASFDVDDLAKQIQASIGSS